MGSCRVAIGLGNTEIAKFIVGTVLGIFVYSFPCSLFFWMAEHCIS